MCGWALRSFGAPWVAHRVWPMPVVPAIVRVGEFLVEVLDPAGLLRDLQRAVAADDRDPGRVVAAVLQAAQALDDDVERRPGADVADDAAHDRGVYGLASSRTGSNAVSPASKSASASASTVGVTVFVGVAVFVTVRAGHGHRRRACDDVRRHRDGRARRRCGRAPSSEPTSPSTDVPVPDRPRTTSLSGRPTTSSTTVTTTSTPTKTPAHAAANVVQPRRAAAAGARTTRRAGRAPPAGGAVRATRRSEWLYTALPTTVSTLATAAPMTVPATPR